MKTPCGGIPPRGDFDCGCSRNSRSYFTMFGRFFQWEADHGIHRLKGGVEHRLHAVKRQRVLFSDSRGLVDGLVGNVGVEFLGEVIVFALHLCAEVVNAVVDIRIHFAEPGIYIGVHLFEARIHVGI